MKERYSSVCSKILNYYPNSLFGNEKLILENIIKENNYNNINIIIFINKIIDRIWHFTLTNPHYYRKGEPFVFLTIGERIPILPFQDMIETNKTRNFTLSLVTDSNILENKFDFSGFIVEIDYLNSFSEPILPIDFKDNKKITKQVKLNIKSGFYSSFDLGDYDSQNDLATLFCEQTSINVIPINRPLLNLKNNNKILTKEDKISLTNNLIYKFLNENDYLFSIELKASLISIYKDYIVEEYLKYFNKEKSLEDFITNVFEKLKKDPMLRNVKKLTKSNKCDNIDGVIGGFSL